MFAVIKTVRSWVNEIGIWSSWQCLRVLMLLISGLILVVLRFCVLEAWGEYQTARQELAVWERVAPPVCELHRPPIDSTRSRARTWTIQWAAYMQQHWQACDVEVREILLPEYRDSESGSFCWRVRMCMSFVHLRQWLAQESHMQVLAMCVELPEHATRGGTLLVTMEVKVV